MVKTTTTQLNNRTSLKEKGNMISELILHIRGSANYGPTKEQMKEYVSKEYSKRRKPKVGQVVIDHLVDRYWQLLEPDNYEEWEKYYKEFRAFLRKIGIGLGSFDRAMQKSTPSPCDRREFLRFLISYYIIAENKAPTYVINNAYQTILVNTHDRFGREIREMSDSLDHILHCISMGFGDLLDGKNESMIPSMSVIKSGFLHHLIAWGRTSGSKADAVLAAPYAPYTNGEPEEWLLYLFGLSGEELSSILHQVLAILLDIIMGAHEPSAKPPAKVVA